MRFYCGTRQLAIRIRIYRPCPHVEIELMIGFIPGLHHPLIEYAAGVGDIGIEIEIELPGNYCFYRGVIGHGEQLRSIAAIRRSESAHFAITPGLRHDPVNNLTGISDLIARKGRLPRAEG